MYIENELNQLIIHGKIKLQIVITECVSNLIFFPKTFQKLAVDFKIFIIDKNNLDLTINSFTLLQYINYQKNESIRIFKCCYNLRS